MISRRSLLKSTYFAPLAPLALRSSLSLSQQVESFDDVGVCSGSPSADGFVLWTRIPAAAHQGGEIVTGLCQLSSDANFDAHSIISTIPFSTNETRDYTVHVKVQGLASMTRYFYRFVCGDYTSDIGRSMTLPKADAELSELKFAFVSCQKMSDGYFTAYQDLNRRALELQFVFHLGDHIYEKETGETRPGDPLGGNEALSLSDYRLKYRYYLSDPHYREARRLYTWIDLWDDHEVVNDYAGDKAIAANPDRFAAAYQAYAEFMPIDREPFADHGGLPSLSFYQSFRFGNLAEFFRMDQRQFRMPNPCSRTFFASRCAAAEAADQSMLGAEQTGWLQNALGSSNCSWKFLLSEVMFTPMRTSIFGNSFVNLDGWDGYPAEREAIYDFIAQQRLENIVALTGDIHAAIDAKLMRHNASRDAKPVSYEIVGASITSSSLGDHLGGLLGRSAEGIIRSANPHIEWSDIFAHGYVIVQVGREGLKASHIRVSSIATSDATASVQRELLLPAAFNRGA